MLNETIERILAGVHAGTSESDAVAAPTVSAVHRLADELQPIVGNLAAKALYLRALHLAGARFQRPGPADLASLETLLAALAQDLKGRDPDDAGLAARALLRSMGDLLISLIGESLTYQILRRAWSIPASDLPSKEETLP